MRAGRWLFGCWLLGVMVFASAADREALKPNNAVVLRAPEWAACDPGYAETVATLPDAAAAKAAPPRDPDDEESSRILMPRVPFAQGNRQKTCASRSPPPPA